MEYEQLSGAGTFHKWEKVGEEVEGIILSFTVDGGTDYNENPCPEITVRTDYGDVTVTAGQASLRRVFTANADRMRRGHQIKIRWDSELDTGKGNPAKLFTVGVSPLPVLEAITAPEPAGDTEPF